MKQKLEGDVVNQIRSQIDLMKQQLEGDLVNQIRSQIDLIKQQLEGDLSRLREELEDVKNGPNALIGQQGLIKDPNQSTVASSFSKLDAQIAVLNQELGLLFKNNSERELDKLNQMSIKLGEE